MQEYLEITEESDFVKFHPAEIYITPVIKTNVFTGDIVYKNDVPTQDFIVLSPSCDLAQKKAKDILLINIEDPSKGILNEKTGIIKKNTAGEEVINESKNIVARLVYNNYSPKYHYIPPYKDIKGGLINFQKLWSCRANTFSDNYTRRGSVTMSFTKDIISRFSYYYSRQGSPDFEFEEIMKLIIA